ncbi:hypothetical protein HY251_04575 [bacterium]|nr:hypothetical protein [bacterium]
MSSRARLLGALLAFGLASAAAGERARGDTTEPLTSEVALLASATAGDARVLVLVDRGEAAVAPVLSLLLDKAPVDTRAVTALPEADRAAILRAQAVLARLGRPAVAALVASLESSSGARRALLGRALAAATARSLEDGDTRTATSGARALAALLLPGRKTVFPHEELLFSGRTTEPREDEEALPRALGALAKVSLPLLVSLAENPDEETRRLAARALAHAGPVREDAATALGHVLERAVAPADRARLGRALGDLGGEAASEALEKALIHGPEGEARDRVLDLEATRNPTAAPRILARNLARLQASDRARAIDAISVLSLPPPPPPKARFVVDPFARRRTKDAKEAREGGREAASSALSSDPSPLVRLAAARALEALGRPEHTNEAQALAARALAALEGESALEVRAETARALVELAPEERLDELRSQGDETTRSCAAAARAGVLPPEAAGDLLQEAFALGRSPSALSRRAAVCALAYGGGKNALGFVVQLARNDPSPAVRLEGTHALARVYGKLAAQQIGQAVLDRELSVRRAAARSLARIGEPTVANVLVVAIGRARKLADRDQGDAEERDFRAALATLVKDSAPSLGAVSRGSGDPLERRIAMAQLGRLATDEAIATLLPIVRDPKVSQDDRDAAARAIERATGRDLADPMWAPLRAR